MTTRESIADAVRQTLIREAGTSVEAAFIYGSVAAGTNMEHSDLDCFVLLRGQPGPAQVTRLRAAFGDLQRDLGFKADPNHPVEVFSVLASVKALDGVLVVRALYTAARGDDLDPMTLDSDGLEILRALLNIRLPVVDSVVLDGLTTLARQRVSFAASLCQVESAHVTRRIGVKRLAEPAPALVLPPSPRRLIKLQSFGSLNAQQRHAQHQDI